MAVRQYIGARYVTKIYENSLDPSSAEWEAGVNFEPLTLVTFNNGSYLSKKDVPAGVGDPASNPSYWVQTGFYNGQIASLQSQIDTLNASTIKHISARKFVFLGDSYSLGQQGLTPETPNGWVDQVINYLGLSASQYYRCTAAEIGSYPAFYASSGAHISWADSIQTMGARINNKDEITDIVIAGGYNEYFSPNHTVAEIETPMAALMSYCKTNFPNATVWLGFIGYNVDCTSAGADVRKFLNTVALPTYKKAAQYGFRVMAGEEHNLWYADDATDGIHPTTHGYSIIARAIANNLLGTKYTGVYEHGNITKTLFTSSDFTGTGGVTTAHFGAGFRRIYNEYGTFVLDKDCSFMNVTLPATGSDVTLGTVTSALPINEAVMIYSGLCYLYANSVLAPYLMNIILYPDGTVKLFNGGTQSLSGHTTGDIVAVTLVNANDMTFDHTTI